MEVVVVKAGATRLEKLHSNRHQQTNTQLLQAGRLSMSPKTNNVRALKGKSITFHGLAQSELTLGSILVFDH